MTQLERIKSLIVSLPKKDQIIAQNKLSKRDFEGLWELVVSDIYLVKKYEERYPEANLADMNVLKSELLLYMEQLGLGDEEDIEDEEEYMSNYDEEFI